MQQTKSAPSRVGTVTEMMLFASGPANATKHMRAGSTSGRKAARRYQRSLSKQRMKVSRYAESGSTQTRGMGAMFCVNRFVTARSKAEAEADRQSGRMKLGFVDISGSDMGATMTPV